MTNAVSKRSMSATSLPMRRVLVIDDEPDIRAVCRLSLERVGGWSVLEADSGAAGLELAAREHPDAILLDVMRPGMDGTETIGQLKRSPSTLDIPVLFLTAKLQPAERERYAQLGAAGVLQKPFDPMALHDEVAKALGWNA